MVTTLHSKPKDNTENILSGPFSLPSVSSLSMKIILAIVLLLFDDGESCEVYNKCRFQSKLCSKDMSLNK